MQRGGFGDGFGEGDRGGSRFEDRGDRSSRYDDRGGKGGDRYGDRGGRGGSNHRGYERSGDQERRGYERGGGYDRGGYDRGGNDRGGYDRGGNDRGGYDRGGHDRGGYDRGGYGRNDSGPPRGPPRQQGFVTTLKDGFGFIDVLGSGIPGRPQQMYFSFGSTISQAPPRVGDEVSFEVQADRRTGKEAAVRVETLPQGTLPKPARHKGVIDRAARDARGGKGGGGGLISYGGDESLPPSTVGYELRDVERGARDGALEKGDLVEFTLHEERGRASARRVTLLEAGGGLVLERGVVVSVKDKFGFIFQEEASGQLFFHFSELAPSGSEVRPGDEVSYHKNVDPRTKKECAAGVKQLPRGTVQLDTVMPGRCVASCHRLW